MLCYAGCTVACLLGMASKELMVSAPLVVLFYDRAFVGGSFREALRRRYGLYLALAGAWILLGFMVAWSGTRGHSSGIGIGIGCWEYLCTQFVAIVNYLKLCVWPCPLVFDYGNYIAENVLEIAVCGVVVVLAGLATAVALWRWPKVGFLGIWFFAILAPTTSFIPELQTVAEHRMYLPLAAVIAGLAVAGCLVGRRLVQSRRISAFRSRILGCCLVLSAVVALAICTFYRNFDYKSDLLIWHDTIAKMPHNDWALINYGNALEKCGQKDEAIDYYRRALKIKPDSVEGHYNLAVVLASRGKYDEAVEHYKKVLDWATARDNKSMARSIRGQIEFYQSLAPAGKAAVAIHWRRPKCPHWLRRRM